MQIATMMAEHAVTTTFQDGTFIALTVIAWTSMQLELPVKKSGKKPAAKPTKKTKKKK